MFSAGVSLIHPELHSPIHTLLTQIQQPEIEEIKCHSKIAFVVVDSYVHTSFAEVTWLSNIRALYHQMELNVSNGTQHLIHMVCTLLVIYTVKRNFYLLPDFCIDDFVVISIENDGSVLIPFFR